MEIVHRNDQSTDIFSPEDRRRGQVITRAPRMETDIGWSVRTGSKGKERPPTNERE